MLLIHEIAVATENMPSGQAIVATASAPARPVVDPNDPLPGRTFSNQRGEL